LQSEKCLAIGQNDDRQGCRRTDCPQAEQNVASGASRSPKRPPSGQSRSGPRNTKRGGGSRSGGEPALRDRLAA